MVCQGREVSYSIVYVQFNQGSMSKCTRHIYTICRLIIGLWGRIPLTKIRGPGELLKIYSCFRFPEALLWISHKESIHFNGRVKYNNRYPILLASGYRQLELWLASTNEINIWSREVLLIIIFNFPFLHGWNSGTTLCLLGELQAYLYFRFM